MVLPAINNQQLPITIPIVITHQNGNPRLELRKIVTNTQIIKLLVSCAFHEQPIMIMPSFTNKIQSISSMLDKGIIIQKEGEYYFTFN